MNIIVATKQQHFVDAFRIRARVFVGEQQVPVHLEIDEYDNVSPIFVAYREGKPLGTGRVVIKGNEAKIGRVAVAKEYRSLGVGSLIILAMMNYLKDHQVQEVTLGAQLGALKFYEKLGFKAYGAVFSEAGIEHIKMKCEVK